LFDFKDAELLLRKTQHSMHPVKAAEAVIGEAASIAVGSSMLLLFAADSVANSRGGARQCAWRDDPVTARERR